MEIETPLSPIVNHENSSDSSGGSPQTKHIGSAKKDSNGDTVKVLADGKVMKVQKTRQRKILSCVYCHSKKIKCSRQQPICNNCDKLGIECKYFINERVSRGGKKSSRVNQNPSKASSDSPSPPAEDSKLSIKLNLPQINDLSYKLNEELKDANSPINFGTNSLLQTPVLNTMSNNITNNFFNTNYSSVKDGQNQQAQGLQQQQLPGNSEEYSFNLSSFTFNNDNILNIVSPLPSTSLPKTNSSSNINSFFTRVNYQQPQITNFVDNITSQQAQQPPPPPQQANQTPSNTSTTQSPYNSHSQPVNPGLNNSLNALSSNPATTINYLYGTNTYYDNENLLQDLLNHVPHSRERSYELLNRYINSVHILLPILVNLQDFVKQHDKYWNNFDPAKPKFNTMNNFNFLQFYTLYLPILYASTISEFEEYDNLLLNQDIDKFLKGFNKICQYYNYPHGLKTILLLLGNVIIQSTSPNPSTMEMSQIIRYAKFLQLHKDPVLSLRISDWEIIKFRRLLWWVIFGLDALTSHNFCLPPVCKFDDFNVLMPDDEDPVYNENGICIEKKLNVGMLSMNVKFKYDRILSELVYQLHNGLSNNITSEEIDEIKQMIVDLFHFIHESIVKMVNFYKVNPPNSVQEMNLINFIKNHSWSFVDRALMLLHKKILLRDGQKEKKLFSNKNDLLGTNLSTNNNSKNSISTSSTNNSNSASHNNSDSSSSNSTVIKNGKDELYPSKIKGDILSLSQFEDTFGQIQEANIIINFDNSSISQLRFNQYENFTYENLHNNLIPSILHNLNDFLKYNDFIKFGKFNWYVKRTIPLDSIILLFIIICVKFKYEFMTINELIIYVKLINKALFILNRKWFKNEKYKRMLSLTNLTWEYILKKFSIVKLINQYNAMNNKKNINSSTNPPTSNGKLEFLDYQVSSYMNMSELFNVMDVPQPILISNGINLGTIKHQISPFNESLDQSNGNQNSNNQLLLDGNGFNPLELASLNQSIFSNQLISNDDAKADNSLGNNSGDKKLENESASLSTTTNDLDLSEIKSELSQLNEKIYYDLRNNFVDINDYCAFYTSLENILHELMEYIHNP